MMDVATRTEMSTRLLFVRQSANCQRLLSSGVTRCETLQLTRVSRGVVDKVVVPLCKLQDLIVGQERASGL
jgi:hypothetical protein